MAPWARSITIKHWSSVQKASCKFTLVGKVEFEIWNLISHKFIWCDGWKICENMFSHASSIKGRNSIQQPIQAKLLTPIISVSTSASRCKKNENKHCCDFPSIQVAMWGWCNSLMIRISFRKDASCRSDFSTQLVLITSSSSDFPLSELDLPSKWKTSVPQY